LRPDRTLAEISTFRTKAKTRVETVSAQDVERSVRQLLADKVSGTMTGVWLLIPEHLRLGTWQFLCDWTGRSSDQPEPRLALQLVNEAAVCATGIRQCRTLSQKGFELANGLPFVASDQAMHLLLDAHTVEEAKRLQFGLGLARRARRHFRGEVLAIDPHRLRSSSRRQMPQRKTHREAAPIKQHQTFFCLDADTKQPLCFTSASSAMSLTAATIPLLQLTASILGPTQQSPLVIADSEHYTTQLVDHVSADTPFDLLLPVASNAAIKRQIARIPQTEYHRHWAGFALAKTLYPMAGTTTGPHHLLIQRSGEANDSFRYKAFLSTRDTAIVDDLSARYPTRWHIEEFFNLDQALGWQRSGTMNLNIRYGKMTLALFAQAAIHQFRSRVGSPYDSWAAQQLAQRLFCAVDGDIRVRDDTIVLTLYNAPNPNLLREHYEHLPDKLEREGVNPHIPWLCNFKLDFRFK
jgi:hypothetical protein